MNNLAPTAVFATALALVANTGHTEQLIPVPSGQPLHLGEVLIDDTQGKDWIRFRFVAPEIGNDGVNYEIAASDMDYLCQHLALPYLAEYGLTPPRVIISLSDQLVEFGKPTPDVTQYFEAYRPENDTCIWEDY